MATKMRLLWSVTTLIALIVILFACGNVKTETTQDVNGTFAGSVTANGQASTMTMVTSQTANQVSGTYGIGAPLNESGTVTGSILGLIYSFTLRRTMPTAATFSSSVDISNGTQKLMGSYGNGVYVYDLTRK